MTITVAKSLASPEIQRARVRYREFIDSVREGAASFRLTPQSESSAYALCFAIFGLQLLKDGAALQAHSVVWDAELRGALRAMRLRRQACSVLSRDKPYLQLLTFTLSALAVLGTLRNDPLGEEVASMLPEDIEASLREAGSMHGVPRSGNHAMFLGILLLHARDYLAIDTQARIDTWVALHLAAMNDFGFWGAAASMSHLQFQNGYHQYELLEFMEIKEVPWQRAARNVASLADPQGHFAPYPGGGGCYDYDAAFMLSADTATIDEHRALLLTTARTILSEQNEDGGFCESQYVRPRSLSNMRRTLQHIAAARGRARWERMRQGATLLRPANDRVHTHWTRYSRKWNESDLWDSWFRMLTVARVDVALNSATDWGFIDYPGIGFHPSVRHRA